MSLIKLTFTNAISSDYEFNKRDAVSRPAQDAVIEKMHINGVAEKACRQHLFMKRKKEAT